MCCAIRLLALLAIPSVSAFTTPSARGPALLNIGARCPGGNNNVLPLQMPIGLVGPHSVVLSMSEGNAGESGKRRRRKRKDGRNLKAEEPAEEDATSASAVVQEESTPPPPATPAPVPATPPTEKKDEVITMQVRDVRDIVSGKPEPKMVEETEGDYDDDDELADDEEWEYYDDDEDDEDQSGSSSSSGDSLKQLLADAKKMRTESGEEADGKSLDVPDGVRNAISTIVTVDFFIVIGLLGWFLTGIFVRAAFGNDAVQIAFNNNFETLVQPALGVLMIASAAGSFIKEPEEDDRGLS